MLYHEFAPQPELRNGTFIPVSSLPDFYARPDSGYCSVYKFDGVAAATIRAQGNSQGLSRFPAHSDRLWIDLDAADSSEAAKEKTRAYTREITKQLQARDLKFSVWFSGSKGYHIAIKIHPMSGLDVPFSQLEFVRNELSLECDYSLYQHGRLLSNPGRLHPKTGMKKHKVYQFDGGTLLSIPILQAPKKQIVASSSLTAQDLARIGLSRVSSLIQSPPLPGMRHQSIWSAASQCLEAGMSKDLVFGILCYANSLFPDPKEQDEILRAVTQAEHQLK